jgi:MSHA biogenesis protein MshM
LYESHYGLRELPFGLTPDTSYFFAGASYQQALNTLLVAAHNGEGFIKIVGEVGNGKTMLCRTFLATLQKPKWAPDADPDTPPEDGDVLDELVAEVRAQGPEHESRFVTAYLPNPYLDPRGLLLAIADEFGVPLNPVVDLHTLVKGVTAGLMKIASKGQQALVCLDEVQAMPQHTLEAVRLLTNLETEKRKLLQVVLFGQPELEERLRQRSTRQLLQRITFQCTLSGLRKDEVAAYLRHRLAAAGYKGKNLFTPMAVSALYNASQGTPRLVNVMAHKALMLGYGEGVHEIGRKHIRAAAEDTPSAFAPKGKIFSWR